MAYLYVSTVEVRSFCHYLRPSTAIGGTGGRFDTGTYKIPCQGVLAATRAFRGVLSCCLFAMTPQVR